MRRRKMREALAEIVELHTPTPLAVYIVEHDTPTLVPRRKFPSTLWCPACDGEPVPCLTLRIARGDAR